MTSLEKQRAQRRERHRQMMASETVEERRERLARMKLYYEAHKDDYRERNRRWRAAHPERVAQQRREAYKRMKANGTTRKQHLRMRYGLTPEEEQALWDRQEGCCAICQAVLIREDYRHTHIDHDHETGRVRGFLCIGCNQALGRFKDSTEILRKAIRYLETT